MKDLKQLMMENNVTDEQMFNKYNTFKGHIKQNHNFSMSLRMAFNTSEQFVLAALGLNYLIDTLTLKTEDPRQRRLFNDNNYGN